MLRSKILGLGLGLVGMAVATSANAAPINFNGLGLNGSGGGASWSVIHKSNTQNSMSGTIWQELEAPSLSNLPLSYSINPASGGSLDNAGGLDGATLDINQSDLQFQYKNGANTNEDLVLRLLSSSLTISYNPGEYATVPTASQFGFGSIAPQYALNGTIDFELRNASGAVMTSTFELINNLEMGPFNGLAVGNGSNGLPENDVVFFVWAGSNTTTDYFTPGYEKYIGIDLGAWGTPIEVPAPGAMILLGFGLAGLIATRRKAA